MPAVTVDGARIPYRLEGSGPVLVLVHGTGAGSVTWESALGYFTGRHTVVLPDLSGSEAAEDDGGELNVELLADQLAAAERPELVRWLITLSGWCGPEDPYIQNGFAVWRTLADNPTAWSRSPSAKQPGPGPPRSPMPDGRPHPLDPRPQRPLRGVTPTRRAAPRPPRPRRPRSRGTA